MLLRRSSHPTHNADEAQSYDAMQNRARQKLAKDRRDDAGGILNWLRARATRPITYQPTAMGQCAFDSYKYDAALSDSDFRL